MFRSSANSFEATALFAARGGLQVGDSDEETAVTTSALSPAINTFGTVEIVQAYSAIDRKNHFFQMLGVNQPNRQTYRAVGNSGQPQVTRRTSRPR
jgi:hypothetical protein